MAWRIPSSGGASSGDGQGIVAAEPMEESKVATKRLKPEEIPAGQNDAEMPQVAAPKRKPKPTRRSRRTKTGMVPQELKTRDAPLLHVLETQSKLLLQVSQQQRVLSGILMTQIIMPNEKEPLKSCISTQKDFQVKLAEARSNRQENEPPPAIGSPILQLFITFLEELAKLNIGANNTAAISAFLEVVTGFEDNVQLVELEIQQVCNAFFIFPVQTDQSRSRIQISLASGPLRKSILSALSMLPDIRVSTGSAQPGYLEEELSEWMSVLNVDSKGSKGSGKASGNASGGRKPSPRPAMGRSGRGKDRARSQQ